MKAAHHRGRHQTIARHLKQQAEANPDTRCWKCNRTMAQVRKTKPRATWIAGHINAGQVGGPYAPECSECSGREGANRTNKRQGTDLTWP